ncbi:pseudouridine kinase [Treponema bryantii]|uniref:Pseudouridine kinase n=1 Tax=Treponema bryantii TaxID=163 RepID=A0A1I3HY78_9SPIR|nr:PfkB family carbohydrate kinase [Treponema bryantii]SFI40527.1 pseudouridine kinase [Treponema bryantii]
MKNILCSGNVSVDIKAYSAEVDDTEAYREGSIELVPGGVGRGMAINLKHLGLNTFIHSVVGKDIFGEYLRGGLEEEGVNTTLLGESKERKTALFSVMASRGKSATCVYSTQILKEITFDEQVEKVIKDNDISAFVMDSNLSDETLAGFYNYKKTHPEIFVFQNATAPDIARKTMQYAPLIDLFGCNEYEAAAILGESSVLPDLTTADKFQALGYKNFIITFGEQGVMVRIGNETWNEPPYTPSQIVDTIGAGDAFASGFLMGFLEGDPVKRCIHYGLTCAKETLLTRDTVSSKLSKSFLEQY